MSHWPLQSISWCWGSWRTRFSSFSLIGAVVGRLHQSGEGEERRDVKGKIQAVGDSKLPKQISFKVGDQWYGVWLQDQEGNPTELEWMGAVVKDSILDFEFTTSKDGKYRNITSAKPPEIVVDKKGEAKPANNYDIGQREGNCNNATATVFSQVVRFGFFVNEADIIPAWRRYLNANREMNGLPPVK